MSLNNNNVIMDEIQKFRKYVREKSLRNTPERELIIKEIFSTHDHFDADGLFVRLRNKEKRVSKASVYRTIPLLIECGLIKEVYFENGHLHYEHIYGHEHHCHLRCICCGRIFEFTDDEMEKLQNQIGQRYDFIVTSYRLELFGYCVRCLPGPGERKACGPLGRGRIES